LEEGFEGLLRDKTRPSRIKPLDGEAAERVVALTLGDPPGETTALEVARKGVTVNTISPGYIGTKMVMAIPKEVLDTKILPQIPLGRLGRPEEIAGLIIYLCSDEAAFVTGANIAINGGQHMQ
jgi:Enoyl-(Acyl carrier protein) reductase